MIALVSELMALVALAASILGSIGPQEALMRATIAYFIGRFVTAFWLGMIELEKESFSPEALPADNRNSSQG